MRIILKYILKSIAEKKLRTFLILLSIAISAGLFFASGAINGSLINMFSERMKQFFGTCDFMIHANSGAAGNFNAGRAEPYMDQLEYIIGGFQGYAEYRHSDNKSLGISLRGMDLVKHSVVSPVEMISESGLYPFDGKKIIVGNTLAARFGWKLGDSVEFKLNNARHKFTVSGIAAPISFLFDDGENYCVIVPQDTLSSLYNMRGRDNVLYVKLKNPEEKRQMLDKFTKLYKGCGFSVFSMTTNIEVPFKLLTVIVCFMSIFIIYSTFKVVTLERLPAIGTFRSIGATRKVTGLILLMESFTYGIAGGILGCGLGIGVLYAMASTTKNSWTKNMDTSITFTPLQLLAAFGMALALCLVSSIVPIFKMTGISIKDIIFNAAEKQYKKSLWKAVSGIFLLITAITVPNVVPKNFSLMLVIDMGCLVMLAISAVLLAPYLTRFLAAVMEAISVFVFGNIGVLAAKNLRENKSLLNSIALLTIGISTLLLVATATDSMSKEVINIFERNYRFDINMRYSRVNKNMEQVVRTIDGVESTHGLFSTMRIDIKGSGEHIQQIDGLGSPRYFDFWNIELDSDPASVIRELDSGRNILLSNSLNYLIGLKKGDKITLRMPMGDRVYTVIGFYDTSLYSGSHALASERYIKLDSGSRYYNSINIKTSKDPAIVAEDIRKRFAREEPSVSTVRELEQRNMENNRQISDILAGFAVLTLLIGVIGVFNNLLISFIERKHSLAVLKSIGMSKRQTVGMIFIEALTGGLVGGIAGTATGYLQLTLVPKIMRDTGQYFPIHYNLSFTLIFVAIGMAITLAASIGPALKSARVDLVSSLKYE